MGFLRSSESYFAWSNAGPILKGLRTEKIGQISDSFNIHFQLAGRPNAHDLRYSFSVNEKVLPRRFAIVIGKNGVGKSQALGQIADAALSCMISLCPQQRFSEEFIMPCAKGSGPGQLPIGLIFLI